MITIQKDKIKECILETQCLLACDDEDVVTDIFTFAWQACAAHYEAELLKRDALIAEKDKALREVIEMYVDDANDADPEESVGAFAKQAISITNDNVRLVPVKWQTYDHDDGEWFTFDTEEEAKEVWPNNNIRRQLYTIVKGAEG